MKESQHAEWKESWRDDWLRWICGFANAEGGVLVIGRDDEGKVVGVADARQLLEELPNKIRDLLGIVVAVDLRRQGGKEYLEIATPAYAAPISYRGRYYQRSGSTLQELKGAALDRFLLRKQGRAWDGVLLPGVTVRNLDAAAIKRFRTLARRSGRVEAGILREPVSDLVARLRLNEGRRLKRAAILLFHKDPERFVSGAFVKIGFFRSESDLAYHDEIHGDLFTQVAGTIELLRTKYLKAAISYEGIQRIETFPVPDAALREAVLNAVVHRDYAVAAPIQIRVFDDRLVLINPAALPEGWTEATLLAPHASQPFNPDIANVFFRAGEIEAWGRGIHRILEACRNAGAPQPRLRLEANMLWFEFPFAAGYLKQFATPADTTGEVAGGVTGEVTPEVTPEVRLLRAMSSASVSSLPRRALQQALALSDDEHFRTAYLLPALERGLIEMTIPDKPNSRLQKYRLTEAGRQRLASELPRGKPR